jgi:hypothetical protein
MTCRPVVIIERQNTLSRTTGEVAGEYAAQTFCTGEGRHLIRNLGSGQRVVALAATRQGNEELPDRTSLGL